MLYKVVYTSMLLYRQMVTVVRLPTFRVCISVSLKSLSDLLDLSLFYYVSIIFYPLLYLLQILSTIDIINLSTISVTCEGSKAPIELLVNCAILCLVMSTIVTGYQYVWHVTLPLLHQSFIENALVQEHVDWKLIRVGLGILLLSFDPLLSFLRYLTSLANIEKFVANSGLHLISPGCDNVSGGLDSILGYSSSAIAWWLISPLTYLLANTLVPNYVPKAIYANDRKTSINDNQNPYAFDSQHTNRSPCSNVTNIFSAYCNYIFHTVRYWFSYDLIMLTICKQWVSYLAKIHNLKVHEENVENNLEGRDINFRRTRNYRSSHNSSILPMTAAIISDSTNIYNKPSSKSCFSIPQANNDHNNRDLFYNWSQQRKQRMPTYWGLLLLEKDELKESFPRFFGWFRIAVVGLIILSGIGNIITKTGRKHFRIAFHKWYLFGCICIGYWDDECFQAFRIKEIGGFCNQMDNDKDEVYYRLISIILSSTAVILQLVQSFSIVSVFAIAFGSAPLFVYSKRLAKALPPLIEWNAWEEAKKREVELIRRRTGFKEVTVNQWVLYLKSYIIFVNESRLLVFSQNVLSTILSLLLVFSSPFMIVTIAMIIVLLIPNIVAKVLNCIIFLGKGLQIQDSEFGLQPIIVTDDEYLEEVSDDCEQGDSESSDDEDGLFAEPNVKVKDTIYYEISVGSKERSSLSDEDMVVSVLSSEMKSDIEENTSYKYFSYGDFDDIVGYYLSLAHSRSNDSIVTAVNGLTDVDTKIFTPRALEGDLFSVSSKESSILTSIDEENSNSSHSLLEDYCNSTNNSMTQSEEVDRNNLDSVYDMLSSQDSDFGRELSEHEYHNEYDYECKSSSNEENYLDELMDHDTSFYQGSIYSNENTAFNYCGFNEAVRNTQPSHDYSHESIGMMMTGDGLSDDDTDDICFEFDVDKQVSLSQNDESENRVLENDSQSLFSIDCIDSNNDLEEFSVALSSHDGISNSMKSLLCDDNSQCTITNSMLKDEDDDEDNCGSLYDILSSHDDLQDRRS